MVDATPQLDRRTGLLDRWLRWIAAGALLLAIGATAGAVVVRQHYYALLQPPGAGDARTFEVRPGDSLTTIAAGLQAAGLVRDARAVRVRAQQRGLAHKLQAGWYELSPASGADAILDAIAAGEVATRKITIPEGLTTAEIAARVEQAGIGSAAEYRRLAGHAAVAPELDGIPAGLGLEGYLFPDTYRLPLAAGPADLIAAQTRRFRRVWEELTAVTPARRPRHAIVTIASLIEEETRHDDERARIAGVIENRLAKGMKLELCSSVLYALGEHRERLLNRDLTVDSPYNTYRHAGPPPGPIANPGKKSLAAALAPQRHDEYYFVLGPDGRHTFTRTYAQHSRAKRAAEKARARR